MSEYFHDYQHPQSNDKNPSQSNNFPSKIEVVLKKSKFEIVKNIIVSVFFVFLVFSMIASIGTVSNLEENMNYTSFETSYFDNKYNQESFSNLPLDGKKVGILNIHGVILDNYSQGVFMDESGVVTPSMVKNQIQLLTEDENVDAILLHISSPGGTVTASDEIFHILDQLEIPIIAYTPNIMASGGYYIASSAEKILGHKQSMIGSIGVIYQMQNIQSLTEEKLGIKTETYKAGKYKDMTSPFRERTEEEKQLLETSLQEAYGVFKGIVQTSRSFSNKEIDNIATGEVWSGTQAKKRNLIDKTVYQDEIANVFAESLKVEKEDIYFINIKEEVGFFDKFMQIFSPSIPMEKAIHQIVPVLPKGVYYLWE